MKDLRGKKVRGFKFSDFYKCGYNKKMDIHDGQIGTIIGIRGNNNSYRVNFGDDYWDYPAELIEQHLVEDTIDRDVLRQELEKFVNYYKCNGSLSITGRTKRWIDEYFEYLDKEESPTKELTLQEIADKFNVPVDKIRIKE
jgi:hypothetical protein